MPEQNLESHNQEKKEIDFETLKKIEILLYKILEPEARERLNNIRLVNMEKYLQIASLLGNLYQSGKITEPLDDDSLKEVLLQTTRTRDFNIVRK